MDLIRHALDVGVTLFDTADIYGQGDSERLLGTTLGAERDRAVIVTKAGQHFTSIQHVATAAKRPATALSQQVPGLRKWIAARRARPLPRNLKTTYLRKSLDASLQRLRTDYVDIFLLHSPSADELRRHEAQLTDLMDELSDRQKIRHWGISCDSTTAVHSAFMFRRLAVLEVPLRLCLEDPAMVQAAVWRGIGLLVREIYASRDGTPATAETRRIGLTHATGIPGAAALVGTTRVNHLDAAINDYLATCRSKKGIVA